MLARKRPDDCARRKGVRVKFRHRNSRPTVFHAAKFTLTPFLPLIARIDLPIALKNNRLLRALRREPVDCTPVWLMRQAGRYLPEYRATRARAGSFLAMAKTPELACEVTLQPLARFPLDAAILFSDILTIPDAMGLGLYFVDGEGPKFERPVRSMQDISRLGVPDMETELRYVMDAVRVVRRELDGSVPLIGFSGSPWTLACYMVEGGGSANFARIKALALNDPGRVAPAAVGQHRRGDRVPVRATCGRRAGAAGVRHLGRRALASDVSRILAAVPGPHRP